MATTTTRLTIDDFERLPIEQAKNHELVDGELVDVSGTTPEHNILRDFLTAELGPFVRNHKLGMVIAEQEYDFDGNAYGPDLSFFSAARLPLLDRHKRVQRFVPDLAIEIVSENDTFKALVRKKERYRHCGTSEVSRLSDAATGLTANAGAHANSRDGTPPPERDLIRRRWL